MFIDDATGKLQHLRFCESESAFDYMISTRLYVEQHGIELITYHRKNMRPLELSFEDELMLRQRNKIETIFSLLKQQYNLISSRHRSISGYFARIYASLCADQICHQNKPQFTTM